MCSKINFKQNHYFTLEEIKHTKKKKKAIYYYYGSQNGGINN